MNENWKDNVTQLLNTQGNFQIRKFDGLLEEVLKNYLNHLQGFDKVFAELGNCNKKFEEFTNIETKGQIRQISISLRRPSPVKISFMCCMGFIVNDNQVILRAKYTEKFLDINNDFVKLTSDPVFQWSSAENFQLNQAIELDFILDFLTGKLKNFYSDYLEDGN